MKEKRARRLVPGRSLLLCGFLPLRCPKRAHSLGLCFPLSRGEDTTLPPFFGSRRSLLRDRSGNRRARTPTATALRRSFKCFYGSIQSIPLGFEKRNNVFRCHVRC